MSNVIALLQAIGQDASAVQSLRCGDGTLLGAVNIDPNERAALLVGDSPRLAILIGAPKIVCCAQDKGPEDDEDDDDEENEAQRAANIACEVR